MKKILMLFISFILIISVSFAADNYSLLNYTNTRSAGMGKVSLGNLDETMLIYNPAMLRTLRGHSFSLLSVGLSLNEDGFDLLDPLQDFSDDFDNVDEDENMVKVLNAYIEGISKEINSDGEDNGEIFNENESSINNQFLRGEFNSYIGGVGHKFGAAIMVSAKSNGIGLVNRPDGPIVNIDGETSLEVPIATAFRITDKIDLGLSWRYVYGLKISTELGANDLIDLSDLVDEEDEDSSVDNDEEKLDLLGVETANGWGTTLGLNYTSKKHIWSLGIQDLLSSLEVNNYEVENEGTDDEDTVKHKMGDYKLPTNLKIGISNIPYKEGRTLKKLLWSLELENLLNNDIDGNGFDDKNFFKKVHAGAEYDLLNKRFLKMKLRYGLNQGYFSYGVGARLLIFDLDYANYTEELGPHIGMKDENFQRFSFGIKF